MAFLRVLSFFGRPISTYDRQRSASAVAVRDLSTKEFSLINELTSTEEKPSYRAVHKLRCQRRGKRSPNVNGSSMRRVNGNLFQL